MKRTVIIGASTNPARYSYMAAEMLKEYGYEFIPVGLREGLLFEKQILKIQERPEIADVDTVTLYVSPKNQTDIYDYIASLKPRRVIFNPGTENESLEKFLNDKEIENVEACTLVMLRSGQF